MMRWNTGARKVRERRRRSEGGKREEGEKKPERIELKGMLLNISLSV